jgi:hypothetical protein
MCGRAEKGVKNDVRACAAKLLQGEHRVSSYMRRAKLALKHMCGMPLSIRGSQLPGSTRRIWKERGRACQLIWARAPPPELAPAPPWAVGDELPEGQRRQRFACNELGGQYPLPLCCFILRRLRPLIARGTTRTEGDLLGTASQIPELLDPAEPVPPPAEAASCPRPEPSQDVLLRGPRRHWR